MRTDMTKLIVPFRNFANSPKINIIIIIIIIIIKNDATWDDVLKSI